MSPWKSISLVAARDFRERVTSRAFQMSTGITILFVVAWILVPAIFFDNDPGKCQNPLDTTVRACSNPSDFHRNQCPGASYLTEHRPAFHGVHPNGRPFDTGRCRLESR